MAHGYEREPLRVPLRQDSFPSPGSARGRSATRPRRGDTDREGVHCGAGIPGHGHNLKNWFSRGRGRDERPTNLVVTSAKGLEARASAEFKEIALLSGIRKLTIERSAYDGVIEVDVEEPKALLSFITEFVRSEPFKVRFILRVIPVNRVVDTKLEEIVGAVKDLAPTIGPGETFRITIESRDSPYTDKELINAIADAVDRKVNLDSPDKVILLEIFGEYAGISVISPQEIVSIQKLKRAT
jgi:tRNA acetyltransferase TAN1